MSLLNIVFFRYKNIIKEKVSFLIYFFNNMKSNRLIKAAIVSTFNFQSRKMLTKIEVEKYKLDSNDV